METCNTYESLRKWGATGLESIMNSSEREEAWLKAGIARTYTERFEFLMALIKLNTVFVNRKYCRQYF